MSTVVDGEDEARKETECRPLLRRRTWRPAAGAEGGEDAVEKSRTRAGGGGARRVDEDDVEGEEVCEVKGATGAGIAGAEENLRRSLWSLPPSGRSGRLCEWEEERERESRRAQSLNYGEVRSWEKGERTR